MGRILFDRLFRSEPLTENEKDLAEWTKGRPDDVIVIFSKVWPSEDGEQFEPFLARNIGVEQKLDDGRIACQWVDVDGRGWPEQWAHIELLARAGLERIVEEKTSS